MTDRNNDFPLVSILTPVHETKLSLLERAFASVQAQKYGPGELEWVVVLHNCSEEYKKEVHRRFDCFENIVLREKDFPGTGLAFARRETLRAASGKYLFFLDGDDELTPLCASKAVAAMEETGADTAIFAAWIKIGTGGFGCWCDADPRQVKLVLAKGDPRVGSTLCYSGAGLWTRVCRRSFVEKKGIDFDETCPNHITDPVFNLETALAADKTVVLPGLVGYIHYYGIGMLVSDRGRAAENILVLLERYFLKYRQSGLKADNLMWFFLRLLLFLAGENASEDRPRKCIQRALEYAAELSPPRMDWPYLQSGADHMYADVMRAAGRE